MAMQASQPDPAAALADPAAMGPPASAAKPALPSAADFRTGADEFGMRTVAALTGPQPENPMANPSFVPNAHPELLQRSLSMSRMLERQVIQSGLMQQAASDAIAELSARGQATIGSLSAVGDGSNPSIVNATANAFQVISSFEGQIANRRLMESLSAQEAAEKELDMQLNSIANLPLDEDGHATTQAKAASAAYSNYMKNGGSPQKRQWATVTSVLQQRLATTASALANAESAQQDIAAKIKRAAPILQVERMKNDVVNSTTSKLFMTPASSKAFLSAVRDAGIPKAERDAGFPSRESAALARVIRMSGREDDPVNAVILEALKSTNPPQALGNAAKQGMIPRGFAAGRLNGIMEYLKTIPQDETYNQATDEAAWMNVQTLTSAMATHPDVNPERVVKIVEIIDVLGSMGLPPNVTQLMLESMGGADAGADEAMTDLYDAMQRILPAIQEMKASSSGTSSKIDALNRSAAIGQALAYSREGWDGNVKLKVPPPPASQPQEVPSAKR